MKMLKKLKRLFIINKKSLEEDIKKLEEQEKELQEIEALSEKKAHIEKTIKERRKKIDSYRRGEE